MDDRLVIPNNWRKNILRTLHSPHQWVSSMKSRANAAVYWPGINNNIRNVWYSCHFYNEIAPQQPKESIILTPVPQYPFQQICADYFEMSGHHHLSIVGRCSGWLNIYHYPPHKTIADTLISTCSAMFISYRIPEKLSNLCQLPSKIFLQNGEWYIDCHLLNTQNQTAEQNWV